MRMHIASDLRHEVTASGSPMSQPVPPADNEVEANAAFASDLTKLTKDTDASRSSSLRIHVFNTSA